MYVRIIIIGRKNKVGADIHFYTETKIDDTWHPLYMPVPEEVIQKETSRMKNGNDPYWINYFSSKNYANYSGRNYYLFTFLVGVRGNEEPYIQPRGIPEDCSALIRKVYERWAGDAHTPHYYYLSELMEVEWEDWFQDDDDGHPLAEFFNDYLPRIINLGLDTDKVRFTFWFDN